MLKNFAHNVFKWHYFDQVYSRFTRDGKMAFFTSQTRPLRRETSQRRQPEVFLAVISLQLAVTDVCRRRILSRLFWQLGTRCSGRCKRVDQMPLHGLSARAKKMAVVERKPLVEVRLHISQFNTGYHH